MSIFWPHMRKDVHNICERCLTCKLAKNKVSPHGLYTQLFIPTTPWIDISMDFVLSLSISKGGRDSIFMVVDRFSKMAHFIPYNKSDDASHMANLLFREVVRIHGLPRTIVSNRDIKFLGSYGVGLVQRFFSPLLVTHKQKDKLRCVVGKSLRDWEEWIPHVEFSYNRVFNSATSHYPFEFLTILTSSPHLIYFLYLFCLIV
ncbi:hypothetical protein CR513_20610, partial [Mucuna pruriens]